MLVVSTYLKRQGVDAWFGSHPPTKTLPLHGDMTKGRLCHVPAVSIFRYGPGLSQEPYRNYLNYSVLFLNRTKCSTVSTGTIARKFAQEPSLDFPCSVNDPCSVPAICNSYFPTVLFDIQSELSIYSSAWELSISC